MKKVNVLVVGQGIAGSLLAYELFNAGISVMVVDDDRPQSSSKVAAGLYNPITGKRMVKTWLADEIFPELRKYYDNLEKVLGSKFHSPMPLYRPFTNIAEQNDWMARLNDPRYKHFIKSIPNKSMVLPGIHDPFGGLVLNHTGSVDLASMLPALRDWFIARGMFQKGTVQSEQLKPSGGCVFENGSFSADRVIFCDGTAISENPFWNHLRTKHVKGEVMTINSKFATNFIVNRGVFIIPKNDGFKVGSTYDHAELSWRPTKKGAEKIMEGLSKFVTLPMKVIDHSAGVRPATYDRRPFIGFHEDWPKIGIFNGFGTKGVSLVPYFAKKMARHIKNGDPLPFEVSVSR